MKLHFFFIFFCVLIVTSCQKRPQVFGIYIDGTFDQFMEDLDKEPWVCPVRFDSVYRISENHLAIQAYSTEIIGLNEDSVKIDSIHFTIELEQEKIKHFAYTMHLSETDFRAIQYAYERIYGSVRYHDITEYGNYCSWMIGKTSLWLSYDFAEQQTKYEYFIN